METFDILIYAGIAAFLAYRLWSVLGQRDDNEEGRPPRPNPFSRVEEPTEEEGRGLILEGRARPVTASALTPAGHAPASLAGALDQVRALDPTFEEKKFLEGAKIVFTRVVAAFAMGDMAPVKRYLGGSVLASFENVLAQRAGSGQTLENKIERMAAVDITAAEVQGSLATLTVEFITHQVNVLRDETKNIIEGTPNRAEEVRDIWVFRRDMKSSDPNWQLIETRS